MSESSRQTSIVVLGATGALSTTKIYPALFRLHCTGLLPPGIKVVGYGSQERTKEEFDALISERFGPGKREAFLRCCTYISTDVGKSLQEDVWDHDRNHLVLFAIPIETFPRVLEVIGRIKQNDKGWTRVVLESPIGDDLVGARSLNAKLESVVGEQNVFRVDGIVTKEIAESIQVLRFMNSLVSPLWDCKNIEAIVIACREMVLPSPEIDKAEFEFFESHGGILLDKVIDLLGFLAVVAMEPPPDGNFTPDAIARERERVLSATEPIDVSKVVLGTCDSYQGQQITFATCVVYVNTPRWKGVPFILKAGKGLYQRRTDIRIQMKRAEWRTCMDENEKIKNNELVIRMEPNEDIYFKVINRLPGPEFRVMETKLDMITSKVKRSSLEFYPNAYEKLIYDVIHNERSAFSSANELEHKFRILQPILEANKTKRIVPETYKRRSRGPLSSYDLMRRVGFSNQDKLVEEQIGISQQKSMLEELSEAFSISTEDMEAIVVNFGREIRAGLKGEPSSLKMLPSFVTRIPNGKETGVCYSLDLGGTNFRVSRFHLDGKGHAKLTDERKFTIPELALKGSTPEPLFDFIADSMTTITGNDDDLQEPKYGFTFSFPVEQTSINSGNLIVWTKGFSTGGVVGENVVALLDIALRKRNFKAKIVALVNDTVGTLAASAYKDPSTVIGVILGTGTNAAYIEKVSNISKLEISNQECMIINIEWGAFGDRRKMLPTTTIDEDLDEMSVNPKKQSFEKMISGFYLGEIARRCFLRLVESKELWGDANTTVPDKLFQPYTFESRFLSDIEYDMTQSLDVVKRIEMQYGVENSTIQDRKILKIVSGFVIHRAARLTACGIAAVLKQTGRQPNQCTVGIDGSVYEHHPSFRERLETALGELGCDCNVVLAKDGSGLGAALIASNL